MAAPTASHLALLMFLIVTSLLLGLGTLGFAGIEALVPVSTACLLQVVLCVPAILILAARLASAPLVATVLSVIVISTPSLLDSIGATLQGRAAETSRVRSLADQLLNTQRQPSGGGSRQLRESLEKLGYVSPPELVALRERQRAAVKSWMSANPGVVTRAQETASKSSRYAQRLGMTFTDDLMNNLEEATGPNWVFMNAFLESLSKAGLKYEVQLSEEEQASARAAIESWLADHWDAMKNANLVFESTTNDAGDGWTRMQPVALMLLIGVAAAWLGRQDYHRPFDAAQMPSWVGQGLRALLRNDPTAGWRVLGGLAVMLGIAALVVGMHLAGIRLERWVIRLLAGVLLLGGMIIFSGLALSEGEKVYPPPPR